MIAHIIARVAADAIQKAGHSCARITLRPAMELTGNGCGRSVVPFLFPD
jgi:hypothetical protein